MKAERIIVAFAFVLVLLLPLIVRQTMPDAPGAIAKKSGGERQTLIIVTPHIEQIRNEFGAGFAAWNARRFPDEPRVEIDWRAPGGTTEILRLLQAVYQALLKRGLNEAATNDEARLSSLDLHLGEFFPAGSVDFDLMFGGGSYDHTRLKDLRGVAVWFKPFPNAGKRTCTVLPPREPIDAAALAKLKELTTDVIIGEQKLRVRFPIDAVEAAEGSGVRGRDALEPLTKGATTLSCVLTLSSVEREASVTMSIPAGFTQAQLDEWFGDNSIGSGQLYQDDRKKSGAADDWQYWLGVALSGFGIVYNRELLSEAGLPEPVSFEQLCDARYFRRLALADPRQSGSVATLYDSILNEAAFDSSRKARRVIDERKLDASKPEEKKEIEAFLAKANEAGWDQGWRVIREICANAHSWASASTFPPMAVSQGEALAGVSIDFYGRGQAQAVLEEGQSPDEGRVGYVDPPGRVFIDADPVSLLRGGPNPKLARRFVEFCMSREGQALWQFPPTTTAAGKSNPPLEDAKAAGTLMGPSISALRRMPSRRDMYETAWASHFLDKADPFKAASKAPLQSWRDGMIVMMGCMGIDTSDDLRRAWSSLTNARRDPAFDKATLAKMESLFYAMPTHAVREKDGTVKELLFSAANYRDISRDTNRWRDPVRGTQAKIEYNRFFRENYRQVADLGP